MQLEQVRAVITGGASGLGHAVAQRLVAAGAKVALFDVNEEKGQAAAAALGANASFHRTDVTSEEGVAANVAAASEAMTMPRRVRSTRRRWATSGSAWTALGSPATATAS